MSPDGRWLAYSGDETGTPLIYVQPFPNIEDGRWLVSPSGTDAFSRAWSPDGRGLFYVNADNVMVAQIETEPTFSASTPVPLRSTLAYTLTGGGRQYDIAPDRERFVFRKPAGRTTEDQSFTGLIFVDNWFEEITERVPVP